MLVPWSSYVARPKRDMTIGIDTRAVIVALILGAGTPMIGLASIIGSRVSLASLFRWRFKLLGVISIVRVILAQIKVLRASS